jgi:hypothetical protein
MNDIYDSQRRPAQAYLTADEVDANPTVLRNPGAKERRRNRSGQVAGASKAQIPVPFCWRSLEMMQSFAYRVLSLSARRVMDRLEIEFELKRRNPQANGFLMCTYNDFVDYGVERNAIAPAVRELVALGSIEVTCKGSAGNAEHRQPTLFLITYRHAGFDYMLKDGWKRVKSLTEAEAVARSARAKKGDARTREFGRKGGLAKASKNKIAIRETLPTPVRETLLMLSQRNPTEGPKSPVREKLPLSQNFPAGAASISTWPTDDPTTNPYRLQIIHIIIESSYLVGNRWVEEMTIAGERRFQRSPAIVVPFPGGDHAKDG